MRIFTLLAICIFISSALFSQQKGNVLISGNIGFAKSKSVEDANDDIHQTSFSFRPSIGKFYKNNRMAGISLNYYHSKYRDSLGENRYGAGVFLRQYKPLGKSLFLFLEESLNGYSSRSDFSYASPGMIKTKEKTVYVNLYPGLAYAINKRLQLELGLPPLLSILYVNSISDYTSNTAVTHTKFSGGSVITGFNENALGSLSFGIQWRLGKR